MNFTAIAKEYRRAGWRDVLPIPPGSKGPPPTGYTGWHGQPVTDTDVEAWAEHTGNVAVRAPDGVLGIDVDDYAGKGGAATVEAMEKRLGALPDGPVSTSRDDGVSGIMWFQVPPGLKWPGVLGAGVELIQAGHRYALVAPSIHPTTGRAYVWSAGAPPTVTDLPDLPAAWVQHLTSGELAQPAAKAPLSDTTLQRIQGPTNNGQCRVIPHRLTTALADVATGNRHDAARDHTLEIMRLGDMGHQGAGEALTELQRCFTAGIQDRSSVRQAELEWHRIALGAAQIIEAAPCPESDRRCCGDGEPTPQETQADYAALVVAPPPTGAAQDTTTTTTPQDNDAQVDALTPRQIAIQARADLLAIEQAAKELAANQAADERLAGLELPPIVTLPAMIEAHDGAEVDWRFEHLAEMSSRILVEASAKAGKSTLIANTINSALSGQPFLGSYPTTPVPADEHLLLVDTELGPRRQARWLKETISPAHRARAHVWNITGKTGSLDITSAATRAALTQQILDTTPTLNLLIVDVAGAWLAPLGLDENSNTDVRRFCDALTALALEVTTTGTVILTHHAGHARQARSRGASAWRDWPDSVWTLQSDDGQRSFAAFGRDIDVNRQDLTYDPATRALTIAPPRHLQPNGFVAAHARERITA